MGQKGDFHVLERRNQVKAETVSAVTETVVQIPRLEMVGRRVHAEEQGGKQFVVEVLQTLRPRYDPRLLACQSCGSALPRMVSDRQLDGSTSGGERDVRGIGPRDGTVVCRPRSMRGFWAAH